MKTTNNKKSSLWLRAKSMKGMLPKRMSLFLNSGKRKERNENLVWGPVSEREIN